MTSPTLIRSPVEGVTEKVDPIACVDERAGSRPSPELPGEPGRYIEVQGPVESLIVRLAAGVTHIGRGLGSDLRLDENSVSRRHAMIVERPGGARILDDRSSNGTFVNGRRVTEADLHDGDVLVLGRVVLRYLEVLAPRERASDRSRPATGAAASP